MTETEKEQLCEKRIVGRAKQSRSKSQSPGQSCASEQSSAHQSFESLRDDSSSTVSSPCDSLEARDLVSDSSGRSFTPPPPLHSPTPSHTHHHHHHHHHHASNSGTSHDHGICNLHVFKVVCSFFLYIFGAILYTLCSTV